MMILLNKETARVLNPIVQGGNNSPLFAFSYLMPRNADINYYLHNYIDTVNGGIKNFRNGIANDPYLLANTYWTYFQQKRFSCVGRWIVYLLCKDIFTSFDFTDDGSNDL